MKVIRIYQYEKCSTCREALKFLANNKFAVEPIDIFTRPPTMAELKKMLEFKNGNIKHLLNATGRVYQEMGLRDKVKMMLDDEILALLAKNGKLIKRPFVLLESQGLIGFKRDEWKTKLNIS